MIDVNELTKRYRGRTVVDRLTFRAEPGQVTGFLGPNGAGKTTTMRVLLGLAAASSGTATVDGHRYRDLRHPTRTVGAQLDPDAIYPGRSARAHLRSLAAAGRLPAVRADRMLEQVGLDPVAGRRIATFSLGMRQRLGIAGALLGDPGVLILDEPVNGLDPEGIRWIRRLLRRLAEQGRTVLLSSHLMSELEQTADRVVVIGAGRLLADTSLAELSARFRQPVLVRSPQADRLRPVLTAAGGTVAGHGDHLEVTSLDAAAIGDLAAAEGVPIWQISDRSLSLEEAYLRITEGETEFAGRPDAVLGGTR